MRYFIDCEFNNAGAGYPITLISIGIVAEDGREFYRENREVILDTLHPWVLEHVVPHLLRAKRDWQWDENANSHVLRPAGIMSSLSGFIGDDPAPEFWGYYCQFDFVLLQQLFGDFEHYPDYWPMYCNDLRAWLDWEALNHVEQPDDAPHHALSDARWIRETFQTYSDAAKGY